MGHGGSKIGVFGDIEGGGQAVAGSNLRGRAHLRWNPYELRPNDSFRLTVTLIGEERTKVAYQKSVPEGYVPSHHRHGEHRHGGRHNTDASFDIGGMHIEYHERGGMNERTHLNPRHGHGHGHNHGHHGHHSRGHHGHHNHHGSGEGTRMITEYAYASSKFMRTTLFLAELNAVSRDGRRDTSVRAHSVSTLANHACLTHSLSLFLSRTQNVHSQDGTYPFDFALPQKLPPTMFDSSSRDSSYFNISYKVRIELVEPKGGWFGTNKTWRYDIPVYVINPVPDLSRSYPINIPPW